MNVLRRLIDELRQHLWHYLLPLVGFGALIALLLVLARPESVPAPTPAHVAAPVRSHSAADEIRVVDEIPLTAAERRAEREDRAAQRREEREDRAAERRAVRAAERRKARTFQTPRAPAPTTVQRGDTHATPVHVERRLTVAEVRKANDGSVAIATQCLAATEGKWNKAESLVGAAVAGQVALIDALRKDPDTPYPVPGSNVASSMRQITVTLISMLSNSPNCSIQAARHLQTAIDGLPR